MTAWLARLAVAAAVFAAGAGAARAAFVDEVATPLTVKADAAGRWLQLRAPGGSGCAAQGGTHATGRDAQLSLERTPGAAPDADPTHCAFVLQVPDALPEDARAIVVRLTGATPGVRGAETSGDELRLVAGERRGVRLAATGAEVDVALAPPGERPGFLRLTVPVRER